MPQNFGEVSITNVYDRTFHYMCDNVEGYKEHLKTFPDMVENIGEYSQQIKPVFDIDAYIDDIDIDKVKTEINSIFPNKNINYATRGVRNTKNGLKYSYRFYVDGVRIQSKNLKKLLIDGGFDKKKEYDLSIYDKNKVLFLPLTNKKINNEIVPELKPVDCSIFECCASYILEDFEDWDAKMPVEPKNVIVDDDKFNNDENIENIDASYIEKKLHIMIDKLNNNRSDNFDTWCKFCWCIINICKYEKISNVKCFKLIHIFSKKSEKYDEDKVDEWIDMNFDKVKNDGYRWKYLYDCLKEDNLEYYNLITIKTYNELKKEFELNNCKILHPPMIIHKNNTGSYDLYSIKSIKESYCHIDCKVANTDKKGITVWETKKFINLWLLDSKIKAYDKIVFKPPPLVALPTEFNTWIDFKICTETLVENERDYFKEYCQYLNNLITDKKVADFILARYAYRLQNPAKRTYVCVIYCGLEGDGKNKLLEPIYKLMDKYTVMLDTAKKLYDTHSMYEKDKLFILINEAGGTANFENSDMLKTRITENELSINPKGIQSYTIDNMCDYDMTTNNFNVVKISDDSYRRFLQVETSSYYRGNTEFFNNYFKDIVENPIALRQIYEGLINFDVSKVIPSGNFQTDKPSTEIEAEVKKQNRDKILWFLEDYINKYNVNSVKVNNSDVFGEWKLWCEKNNVKIEYNSIQFGIKVSQIIKKYFSITKYIEKDTKHSITTFKIVDCKKFFNELNGVKFVNDDE